MLGPYGGTLSAGSLDRLGGLICEWVDPYGEGQSILMACCFFERFDRMLGLYGGTLSAGSLDRLGGLIANGLIRTGKGKAS